MNTDDALKWAFESDWGTDWGKDCQAMVQLAEEVNRLIRLNLSTQKHADGLLEKLHTAEKGRDRYKAALEWVRENVMIASCYDFTVAVNKALEPEAAEAVPSQIGVCGACGGSDWRGMRDTERGVIAYACTCGHSWECRG